MEIFKINTNPRNEPIAPLVIGTSDISNHIPIYANPLFSRRASSILKMETEEVLSYYKLEGLGEVNKLSYDEILKDLKKGSPYYGCNCFSFIVDDNTYKIGVHRGYIIDNYNNILMVLTYKRDIPIYDESSNINVEALRLYVSKEFITNPIYKNIYKRLYTDYILPLIELDVEVLYVKMQSIEEKLFANSFRVDFSCIEELTKHLSEEVTNVLCYEEPEFLPELVEELNESDSDNTTIDLPF